MNRFSVLVAALALVFASEAAPAMEAAAPLPALSERLSVIDRSLSELRKADLASLTSRWAMEKVEAGLSCPDLAKMLGEIAADYVQDTSWEMHVAALQFLSVCTSSRFGNPSAVIDPLLQSPNSVVRDIARAARAREDLRRIPMEMKFISLDGKEVDLEKWRGRVVLVDFRSIFGCGACTNDEPMLKAMYEKYRNAGFEIISIINDRFKDQSYEMKRRKLARPRDVLLDEISKSGLSWPTQWDGTDEENTYFARYGMYGKPTYFLLNKEGLLVDPLGPRSGDSQRILRDPETLEMSIRYYLGLDVMARDLP